MEAAGQEVLAAVVPPWLLFKAGLRLLPEKHTRAVNMFTCALVSFMLR